MYIKFKTESDYQNYTVEASLPSGTIAFIEEKNQIYFTTNNLGGEVKTYQLTEGDGSLPEEAQQLLNQIVEDLGKEKERIDTLVSGDTTTAIDNFKEIEEFLKGFTDSEAESLKEKLDSKANAADVYTKEEIDDKGYLTEHQSLDDYYTKDEVDNKGYLTEHQSLEDYYTKEEVDEELEGKLNKDEYQPYDDTEVKQSIDDIENVISSKITLSAELEDGSTVTYELLGKQI